MIEGPSSEARAVREGCVIAGKFRLERVLGEGGMGVVYAAVHLDLRKHVAIKIVRDELATREDAVERMMNEACTAASLRSEHVARVLDVDRLPGGAPFIVMEYLEGDDLGALLAAEGPLAPERAVGFVLEACEAVAEAHSVGIVHRDLKPENLFVTSRADGEPMIKVLDFGIAKNLFADPRASLTNPTSLIGSPEYMAPEAMRALDAVGPSADVWSLGAVLHELLCGQRPFEGATIPEVCARVLDDDPPDLRSRAPRVSGGLAAVVLRCLAKDPAARYPDVASLAAALAPHGGAGADDVADRVARVGSGPRLRPREPLSTPRPALRPPARDGGRPSPAPSALVTTIGPPPRRTSWQRAATLGAMVGLGVVVVAVASGGVERRQLSALADVALGDVDLDARHAAPGVAAPAEIAAEVAAEAPVERDDDDDALPAAGAPAIVPAAVVTDRGPAPGAKRPARRAPPKEEPAAARSASAGSAPAAARSTEVPAGADAAPPASARGGPADAWDPAVFGGRR